MSRRLVLSGWRRLAVFSSRHTPSTFAWPVKLSGRASSAANDDRKLIVPLWLVSYAVPALCAGHSVNPASTGPLVLGTRRFSRCTTGTLVSPVVRGDLLMA